MENFATLLGPIGGWIIFGILGVASLVMAGLAMGYAFSNDDPDDNASKFTISATVIGAAFIVFAIVFFCNNRFRPKFFWY